MFSNDEFPKSNLSELLDKFEQSLTANDNMFFDSEELEGIIEHYIVANKLKLAIKAIYKGEELYPFDSFYYQKRAQVLTLQGKIKEGVEMLETALEKDPSNIDSLFLLGEIYEREKDYTKALSYYLNALENAESSMETLLCIGNCYLMSDRSDQAAIFFEKAASEKEFNEHILADVHFYYDEAKKYRDGIRFFNSVIDESPYNFGAWHFLGLMHQSNGEPTLALNAQDYSLIINENYMPAIYNSALVHYDQKQYKQALKYFLKCLEFGGEDALTRTDIANCYEGINNYQESQKQFRRAIELDEFVTEAWFGLGQSIISNQEDYKEAIPFLEKAFYLEDQDQEYAASLAEAYYKTNQIDKSIDLCTEFIVNNPEEYFGWTLLAKYQLIDCQYREAAELLEDALQYLPDNAHILYYLSAARFILGEKNQAQDALTLALKIDVEKYHLLFEMAPFLEHDSIVQNLIDLYKN